jgi:uncharacterized membrane protein
MNQAASRECQICHQRKNRSQLMPAELVRPSLVELIRQDHPDWSAEGFICHEDLNHYRAEHMQDLLEAERGELSALEQEVVDSLRDQDLISSNVEEEFTQRATFGERMADLIAKFGGSWSFLFCFAVLMVVWMSVNAIAISARPFDPYPYILLNLVLSCLAAIQAPVIMMSQNRQEARDRARAEHDYTVNLKAELEIRQLHSKLDMLLTHQWQRLLEIQELQVELMHDRGARN